MLRRDAALTHTQQNLHLHLESVDIASQFNELLHRLQSERGLTPKHDGNTESPTLPPNVSGNGNLSGDGPPAALVSPEWER